MPAVWYSQTAQGNIADMLSIDIHTHILPPLLPQFKQRFGYGGFIEMQQSQTCSAHLHYDDGRFFRKVASNCWDPDVRMQECDAHHINVQVLSTVPVMFCYWTKPHDGLVVAQYLNDHIAGVVARYPQRFVGLGSVPLQDPQLAITELERCVQQLGLRGVQIGSHVNDHNLDAPALFPFFAAAEALGACIFVHPWDMLGLHEMPKYALPWLVGMPAETTRAICSLIFSGTLQRLPRLRIAFAHGGGSFPATLGRIAHGFMMQPELCAVENNINPRAYLSRLYFDSLVHDPVSLQFLLQLTGVERVALGSDYPFPLGEAKPGTLIRSLSGLSDTDKQRLLSGTALEWLGLTEDKFHV